MSGQHSRRRRPINEEHLALKYADFIVIDRNIFDIPVAELHQTQVERTVVGGRVVFQR